MKYFIIAGEASGDLHGAALMKSLKSLDQEAEFMFFGGDLMVAQGGQLLKHYRNMAFMGGIEVLMNLNKINENFKLCRTRLLEFRPDALILIDYPGFNLKMAKFAHQNGIRVFYFILPKVWAWKEWRVKALKKYVNEFFSIFPFEPDFFRKYDVNVHYVGNPLMDTVDQFLESAATKSRLEFLRENNLTDRPLVALLPGSRTQEIRNMLPVMTRLADDFPDYQFVISGATALTRELYSECSLNPAIPVLFGKTYEMLFFAHAAVVTSGTATLETALLKVPQVVLYKMAGGKIGYRIFRFIFLKVKFVSLPNLILDRDFLKEFVMDTMNYRFVKPEVGKLLSDDHYRLSIMHNYQELQLKTGGKGASERAAFQMNQILKSYTQIV
jgi:lipid-A-disaccharide synthase